MTAVLSQPVVAADGTVLDVDVYDDVDGRADDAVILVHGLIQNKNAFVVPGFSAPALLNRAGLRVYAADMRGRDGGSARHDLATYVDVDAVAVIDAVRARHRRVFWVGHSMGGLIGLAAPRPLDGIVALGSPLFPGTDALRALAVDKRLMQFSRITARRGVKFPGAFYSKAFHALRAVLDSDNAAARALWPLPLWKPGSFSSEADLAHTLRAAFADDAHHVVADLCELGVSHGQRAGRLNYAARLAAQRAPALFVAGSVDALAPVDSAHALYARTGSARKEFKVADAGHIDLIVGDVARSDVWPAVIRFLRSY